MATSAVRTTTSRGSARTRPPCCATPRASGTARAPLPAWPDVGGLPGSAFDTFEWNEGYRPTFGMVGIDRAGGLRREVRESARRFGALARTRSLSVFE
ncbi:MAG TPA: family 1 glycosylhydrolase [Solirubrobacteraceae bacterium]|nr:family 1 glycosylhydrolase [Solirubrobacteraceae bacterium]